MPAATTIDFVPVSVPVGVEKLLVRASKKATYNGKPYDIGYVTLLRTGDELLKTGTK